MKLHLYTTLTKHCNIKYYNENIFIMIDKEKNCNCCESNIWSCINNINIINDTSPCHIISSLSPISQPSTKLVSASHINLIIYVFLIHLLSLPGIIWYTYTIIFNAYIINSTCFFPINQQVHHLLTYIDELFQTYNHLQQLQIINFI